jgi:hypothetical protein
MAVALAIAVRRANRADLENPRDRTTPTIRRRTAAERWSTVRDRSAEVAGWLLHPRAHHRH